MIEKRLKLGVKMGDRTMGLRMMGQGSTKWLAS